MAKEKKVKKPKSKARKITEWVLFGVFGALSLVVMAGLIDSMVHKKENYEQPIRFGVGTFVIITDSMEPEIKVDDMVITYKEKVEDFVERFKKGETVDIAFADLNIGVSDFVPDTDAFKKENGGSRSKETKLVMTHRLREVHVNEDIEYGKGRYFFVTSGINTGGVQSLEGEYQLITEKQYLGTVKMVNTALGHFMSFVSSAYGLLILLLVPATYLIVMSSIDIYKAVKEDEAASNEPSNNSGDHLSNLSEKDKQRLKDELLDEMIKAKKEKK